jgi:hypothetical protein
LGGGGREGLDDLLVPRSSVDWSSNDGKYRREAGDGRGGFVCGAVPSLSLSLSHCLSLTVSLSLSVAGSPVEKSPGASFKGTPVSCIFVLLMRPKCEGYSQAMSRDNGDGFFAIA